MFSKKRMDARKGNRGLTGFMYAKLRLYNKKASCLYVSKVTWRFSGSQKQFESHQMNCMGLFKMRILVYRGRGGGLKSSRACSYVIYEGSR